MGGSAPKGGNILMKLQELSNLEAEMQKQQKQHQQTHSQLERMKAAASQHANLENDLKCKEHECALIEERISRSEHHAAEQTLKDAQAQVTQLEAEIKGMPEEKKML